MLFATLGLIGLVGASAIDLQHRNNGAERGVLCGTTSTAKAAVQPRAPSLHLRNERAENTPTLMPIEIVLQILCANSTTEGGDIPGRLINEQIAYLNDAFRPVGFEFHVSEVVRTINEQWYHNLRRSTDIEDQVVTLRKGGNATLNIYTYGTNYDPGWSWATLPNELGGGLQHDGIFLHRRAWRGGDYPEFELGGVLVHEVGHWFGLYHTVSFDCEESFDYVDDTPIELAPEAVGGCDIGRDSCPNQPGIDLIHNWMGFSRDTCRGDFTPGQIQRMKEQMAKFRQVVSPGIDVDQIPDDGA